MDGNKRELKPCKLCGEAEFLTTDSPYWSDSWRVFCNNCGSYGPPKESIEQAKKAWNDSTLPPFRVLVEIPPTDDDGCCNMNCRFNLRYAICSEGLHDLKSKIGFLKPGSSCPRYPVNPVNPVEENPEEPTRTNEVNQDD